MNLTFDQVRKYYEKRLERSLPPRPKVSVKCPFHDDATASATVFLSGNGGFNCQACPAKGNTFQFEMRLSNCTMEEAWEKIAEITGAELESTGPKGPCTGVYDYRQVDGTIAFQKRRYSRPDGKKDFFIFRSDGNNGWLSGLTDEQKNRKVLYNLPDLVTANVVLLPEGEKDCDTLNGLNIFAGHPDIRVAATTNSEGAWEPGHAPKWCDHYNPYFTGKRVIIFEDNDEPGRVWADYVSAQVGKFAESVRRVSFHDLAEKGDVTDWMKLHTEQDLLKRIIASPRWEPKEKRVKQRKMFISAPDFADSVSENIDWLVRGVIQRGANGFICAPPKGAKSWVSLDMLISLALGLPWIGFEVPVPVKCGLVSREDNPALTAWRLKKLYPGKMTMHPALLESNLYINSRRQTSQFFLDCNEDVVELIADIKRLELELVMLDVFNVMHNADENDNTEMVKVMAQVRRIQDESGAAVGIIHHYSKALEGSMTQRLRGAGAIAGFAEWLIGLTMVDEELKVRRMDFELKADQPPDSIYFKIESEELTGISRIMRVEYEPVERTPVRRMKEVKSHQPSFGQSFHEKD